MKIEELKKGIKNIKEPRRTGYGNIRHKLEDIINLVSQAQYKRISKKRLMFRAALEPALFLDILLDPSSVSPQ